VSVPSSGRVDVSFDWTFASSDLDMVVTRTDCISGASAYSGNCFAFGSDKSTRKPARVTFDSTGAVVIRVWIVNFAQVQESGVMNVLLTR